MMSVSRDSRHRDFLSLAHPLSLGQADAVASDRCRSTRAGRLGRRQQLDGHIAHGGLRQWRGRAFAGDARLDRFEQGRSSGRHAAADDDPFDAEGQDERSDRSGEVIGHSVGDLDRDLVAGRSGAEDICGLRMGDRTVLRPAASASSAWRPIAGPAAIVSRQPRSPHAQTTPSGSATTWPTSPAKLLSPRNSAPVENDAGRDAGPDRQEGDARRRLSRPVGRLLAQPDRSSAGVVLDEGRHAQLGLQHRSQQQVGDAQVDGHADRSVVRVDVARDGDADRGESCRSSRRASSTRPAIWPTSDDGSVGVTCS